MIIAIDVDDVLADFSEGFIKYIKKYKKRDVEIHDLKKEEWWTSWGTSLEDAVATIHEFLHAEESMQIEPKTGAMRALKLLKNAGHKLYVITGRPMNIHDRTKEWIHDNLPNVFEEIFCTDFHIVDGNDKLTKGQICKKIKADYIIDDYPGYAQECVDSGTHVLLFESFWNHAFETTAGMTRVKNWEEALEVIESKV